MSRRLAFEVLRRVETGARVADALAQLATGKGGDARDLDLNREIATGVLRHRGAVDALIGARSSRPVDAMDAATRNALRVGAFQIGWLDRVPRHAAVDTSVELVRVGRNPKAAGFVNAVLRKAADLVGAPKPGDGDDAPRRTVPRGDGTHLPLAEDVFADPAADLAGHLAARWSHPRWMVERFLAQRTADEVRGILAAGIARPPLSLRPAEGRADELRAALAARGIAVEDEGRCLLVRGAGRVEELPGFQEGWFAVQDASAAEVAPALAATKGARVLDLCAAPGGKTIALAEAVGPEGAVLAVDLAGERLEKMRAEILRRGLTNVALLAADATDASALPTGVAGRGKPGFHFVLLDAPCSNTGVLARRVEARWRLKGPEEVAGLAELQLRLLHVAAGRLRRGARAVYSTCSLDKDENEGVVAAFLAESPDFRLESETTRLPVAGRRDGGYVAALVRS
jgi:16S rRNA (cytosine967-C5)-methyltransferase